MKLFLHIGTEKTGTTSLQNWGAANREALLEQGIFYSRSLGATNHRRFYLAALSFDRSDKGFSVFDIKDNAGREKFSRDVADDLVAETVEARACGCRAFVISSEHCHSRLTRYEEVENACKLVTGHFDEIEILCSLRPQIDVAVSLTSTAARMRQPVSATFFDNVTTTNLYYDYASLIERWCAAFGQSAVTILPFRKVPDTVAYLINRLDADTSTLRAAKWVNEAVDIRSMAMVNALISKTGKGAFNPLVNLHLDKLNCNEKLQPGLALARTIQGRFAETNARLAASWPEVSAGELEPDWSKYDKPSNLHLLESECVFFDQMFELIQLLNGKVIVAELLEKVTDAEAKLTKGQLRMAGHITKDARRQVESLLNQNNAPTLPSRLLQRLSKLEEKFAP